jgi:hypothetical protein
VDGRVKTYEIPWDRRERDGLPSAWFSTVKAMVLKPSDFFAQLDPQGSVGDAILFGFISTLPSGALLFLIYFGMALFMLATGEGEAAFAMIIVAFFYGIATPFLSVGAWLMWACIQHVCLLLFGGGSQGFAASVRGVMFGLGVIGGGGIPCLGIVFVLWSMALQALALHHLHGDGIGKVILAICVPLLSCCGLFGGLVFLLGALG